MRKYFILLLIVTAVYLGLQEMWSTVPGASSPVATSDAPQLAAAVPPGARVSVQSSLEASSDDPVITTARAYLLKHREELRLQDYHELRPQVFSNPLGSTVRFDVFQDGLPLLGAYIDVEMDAEREISSMTSHYEPYPHVETQSKEVLSMEEIRTRLPARYGSIAGEAPSLMLLPSGTETELELVYVMRFIDKELGSRPVQILFRATDGQVLRKSIARAEFK